MNKIVSAALASIIAALGIFSIKSVQTSKISQDEMNLLADHTKPCPEGGKRTVEPISKPEKPAPSKA